jgi:hypothetical protein
MKGVVDIEFILSVVVFLSTISFVSFLIIGNIPLLHGNAASEDLRSRAYQVSQILLTDRGEPVNWDPNTVTRIGLTNGEGYVLNTTKIVNLQTLCTGSYTTVKSLLGQDYRTDFHISVKDSGNQTLLYCGPPVLSLLRPEFRIVRVAVLNDTRIVSLEVGVL